MEFRLFNINDIDHTRIVKFLHNFFIKDSYQIKKVGTPSSNEYIIKFIPKIETTGLNKYLKSQGYDFTLKENKMKLTLKEKQLVKEYAKSLQSKKLNEDDHPGKSATDSLDSDLRDLLDQNENFKDNVVSILVEMDDSIGTDHPIYKRLEKLIDSIEKISYILPLIFKDYKKELEL